jgi:hypothetical protein
MLSPKKSPRAVFCRQMKLKIANGDIGEAQRDPWTLNTNNQHLTCHNLPFVNLSHFKPFQKDHTCILGNPQLITLRFFSTYQWRIIRAWSAVAGCWSSWNWNVVDNFTGRSFVIFFFCADQKCIMTDMSSKSFWLKKNLLYILWLIDWWLILSEQYFNYWYIHVINIFIHDKLV